jgi:hypothetical protein
LIVEVTVFSIYFSLFPLPDTTSQPPREHTSRPFLDDKGSFSVLLKFILLLIFHCFLQVDYARHWLYGGCISFVNFI